jgi:branched-chain amino acid transport system substrate-binding protein
MKVKTRRRAWVAIPVAAGLVLAACSGDDDSSSTNTAAPATTAAGGSGTTAAGSATTAAAGGSGTTAAAAGSGTAAAAPTGEPIKLTTVYQGKSGLAVDPTLPDGAKAAVKEINDAGGIKGRPLEYAACDDQGDNTRARQCATDAINGDVVAAVGTVTTEANIYLPEFAKVNLASIGSYANAAEDFSSLVSFPLIGGTGNSPGAVANGLIRKGVTKMGFASIDTGTDTLVNAVKVGLQPFNVPLVASTKFAATPPDMAPYVTAATANGADGVEVFALAADVISFVRELRSQGSNIPVGVVTNDYPAVFKQLGDQAIGIVSQNDFYPANFTDVGAVQREVDAFKAAGVESSLDDPYALNSYAAVMVFAAVANAVPDVTRDAIVQQLAKTSNLDIGVTAPLQFVTGNVANLGPRIFNNCVFLTEWAANGQKAISDNWIDPSTNKDCPSPSKS